MYAFGHQGHPATIDLPCTTDVGANHHGVLQAFVTRGDRRRCEPRDQQSGPHERGLKTDGRRTDPREATQTPGRSSPAGRSPAPRRPPAGHTDPPGATPPSSADAGSDAPAIPPSSTPVPNSRGNVSVCDLTVQRVRVLPGDPVHVLRPRTGEFVEPAQVRPRVGEDSSDYPSDIR